MASTLTNLIYHIVFSTKHRKPFLIPSVQKEVNRYLGGIIKSKGGIPLRIGGVEDHVHLALILKPSQSLSKIVRAIKSSSSKWLNNGDLIKESFAWQEGYGAFTVSKSQIQSVVRYIENQKEHHKRFEFKEEFLEILKRHQIDFEEKYLW